MWLTGRNYIAHTVHDNITLMFHSVFIPSLLNDLPILWCACMVHLGTGWKRLQNETISWATKWWDTGEMMCAFEELWNERRQSRGAIIFAYCPIAWKYSFLLSFQIFFLRKVGFSDSSVWNRFVFSMLRSGYSGLLQGEVEASVCTWQDKPSLFLWLHKWRSPHFIFVL